MLDHRKLPRRVGIYCRLSYAPDGSLEKVERQETDCRQLGARLDWPISEQHVYVDNSRSAWQRNRKRPAWDRMLEAVEAGYEGDGIDGLLIYHGDRLIRQPYDLETLIGLAEHKGFRVASPSGTRDLDSPDDRYILRIEAAGACREVDALVRRVRRANQMLAEKGLRRGGGRYRPFGFGVETGRVVVRQGRRPGQGERLVPEVDWNQVRPDEAKLIVQAAERLLAGQRTYAIARWLSTRCSTTAGNPWSRPALRAMLLSPRIAGLTEYEGTLYRAVWDPIISHEMWEGVRAVYRHNAEAQPHRGRERRSLLSGVAECGRGCGGRFRAASGGRRKASRLYACEGCGLARNMQYVDAWVEGHVVQLLQDPRLAEELARGAGRPGVAAEIGALEARKAELERVIEQAADDPDVDPVLAMRTLAGYKRRLDGLRQELAGSSRLRMVGRLMGVSREEWEAEPVDVRSAVVAALFRVVIMPVGRRGPGFDPSSVLVERRLGEGG
ncbi:recombinase family protein [Streptomyces sp. NBRC 109706]|uniref:recombinase family protein n=1 Tax=Streptomyces sp. NBRC 109706 TaxID=1550035 RepID=UPI000782E094|nr:recombinase family protein [Streptomyces sp. NBRC 109706]